MPERFFVSGPANSKYNQQDVRNEIRAIAMKYREDLAKLREEFRKALEAKFPDVKVHTAYTEAEPDMTIMFEAVD